MRRPARRLREQGRRGGTVRCWIQGWHATRHPEMSRWVLSCSATTRAMHAVCSRTRGWQRGKERRKRAAGAAHLPMRGCRRSGRSMVLAMPMMERRDPLRPGHSNRLYSTVCRQGRVRQVVHHSPRETVHPSDGPAPRCLLLPPLSPPPYTHTHTHLRPVDEQVHLVHQHDGGPPRGASPPAPAAEHRLQRLGRLLRAGTVARQRLHGWAGARPGRVAPWLLGTRQQAAQCGGAPGCFAPTRRCM